MRSRREEQNLHVGIRPDRLLDLREHLGSLRIIRRGAAGQHQPAIMTLFDHAVSLHDAHGILKPVES